MSLSSSDSACFSPIDGASGSVTVDGRPPASSRHGGYATRVLIGAAGTGKTSRLLVLLDEAIERTGVGPEGVLFASLTRAARKEAADRAAVRWGVSPDLLLRDLWFKTMHAIAFRAASQGDLLTDSAEDRRWVETATGGLDPDGRALAAWDRSRARIEPFNGGAHAVAAVESYESAKRIQGRCDFTDLLAAFAGVRFTAAGSVSFVRPIGDVPPGIVIAAFDEHQDASALLDRCCRRIVDESPALDEVIVAGDPHQSIYGFLGASPTALMEWSSRATIMETQEKTYRCAAPIIAAGEEILRPTAPYRPRKMQAAADRAGNIVVLSAEAAVDAAIANRGTTLILARCGFSLPRYLELLDSAGAPVCSIDSSGPTQKSRGMAALYRLERDEVVDAGDFALAVAALPAKGLFARGAKSQWARPDFVASWGALTVDQVESAGGLPELVAAIRSGEWASRIEGGAAWRAKVNAVGLDDVLHPRIRVGTIHSSKGMEADLVVVTTECSRATAKSDPDEERRIAYVAVTRTKGDCVIVPEGEIRMEALALAASMRSAVA